MNEATLVFSLVVGCTCAFVAIYSARNRFWYGLYVNLPLAMINSALFGFNLGKVIA